MLYVYLGTDRAKARGEMNKTAEAAAEKEDARLVRITDAHGLADIRSALQGEGLFGERQLVIFDGVLSSEILRGTLLVELSRIAMSDEVFYIYEESVDAATKKILEKHVNKIERYDRAKKQESGSIFGLARALEKGDKKGLWIGLERELQKGAAPEAIHGALFWGAKQMLLSARKGTDDEARSRRYIAELAELPHRSRRANVPLDYALLRFSLSVA